MLFKIKVLFFGILAFQTNSMAYENVKCAQSAVKSAVFKNYQIHKVSSSSCGTQLVSSGDFLETYLVCISDETEPSEWTVVVSKSNNACKLKYIGMQDTGSMKRFLDETKNLKTLECAIDDNGLRNSKVVCK